MKYLVIVVVFAAVAASAAAVSGGPDPAYVDRINAWRAAQQADLKRDGGWLSVAGLFWLHDGENRMGTASSCPVRLPEGPPDAGAFILNRGRVTVEVASGATVTENGQPVESQEVKPDMSGAPDRLHLGALTMTVIQRGARTGIRIYDRNCKGYKAFHGQHWYPVNEAWRIEATYVPYDPPHKMPIANVLGDTADVTVPGYATFTVDGKECRLEAQASGDGLFFNFRDLTTGVSTYPAGRFLDAPKPENGQVILDFNQATNPPCAFTAFATCPLPPRANYLAVAIPAGEKTYHHPE